MWYNQFLRKKFLVGVNISNLPISIILMKIGFSDYSIMCCKPTLPYIRGITACGAVLFLISFIAIVSFVKNLKGLTNLYMFLLLILSICQFSISFAFFSENYEKLEQKSSDWWEWDNKHAPFDSIHKSEKKFGCCGYDQSDPRRDANTSDPKMIEERFWCFHNVDSCNEKKKSPYSGYKLSYESSQNKDYSLTILNRFDQYGVTEDLTCPTCKRPFTNQFKKIIFMVGGIGMFFSITEFIASFLTFQYLRKEYLRRTGARRLSASFES